MTRRFLQFDCEGDSLRATLDEADGRVGLLIVSGGNEIRSGAFAGQANLAEGIRDSGYPVFRFDRRGIGDSEGENAGFRAAGPDIAAAVTAFRSACPHVERILAYGNCDGASALMLHGAAQCDGLLLSNPWAFDDSNVAPDKAAAPETIRTRYAAKLVKPGEWKRLLSGKVSLTKLFGGLQLAAKRRSSPTRLSLEMQAAMAGFNRPLTVLISERDRTGGFFKACWRGAGRIQMVDGADHAFSAQADRIALEDALASALHEQARQLDMG